MKLSLHELPTTSYANRRNTPKTHRPPNKPPILPKLSTNYDLIMQNKANFPDDQMNVNKVLTKDYENKSNLPLGQNKPNTKPNKANLPDAQMNVNKVLTKEYENIANCSLVENKPKTNPIQTQSNPISKDALSQVLFFRVFLCLFILILKQTTKRRLDKTCFASCPLLFTGKSFRKSKYILFTKRCKIGNYWRIKYPKILLNNRKEFLDGS